MYPKDLPPADEDHPRLELEDAGLVVRPAHVWAAGELAVQLEDLSGESPGEKNKSFGFPYRKYGVCLTQCLQMSR